MKQSFTLLSLVVIAVIIGLYNCKDKDSTDPAPDTRTKKEFITLAQWKLTTSTCNVAVDTDGKDGASTDLLSQMLECDRDDTYLYKLDSTTLEYTNVKCKSSEPNAWKGSWIFKNNETTLYWNGYDYPLIELNATKMTMKYSFKIGADTYEITDTYTHPK